MLWQLQFRKQLEESSRDKTFKLLRNLRLALNTKIKHHMNMITVKTNLSFLATDFILSQSLQEKAVASITVSKIIKYIMTVFDLKHEMRPDITNLRAIPNRIEFHKNHLDSFLKLKLLRSVAVDESYLLDRVVSTLQHYTDSAQKGVYDFGSFTSFLVANIETVNLVYYHS